MIRIDEESVFKHIEDKKPKAVAFSAPDGLLGQVEELMRKVEERYGISAYLLADPCWGICDSHDLDAERLGADLHFNVGHTVSVGKLNERTILIDAFDDVSFDSVLEKALPILKPYSRIGLCTSSQHLPALEPARRFLMEHGIEAIVGEGIGLLNAGQVFGCEFYPAYLIKERVRALAFLGQSRFHALGVAMATGLPTFMLDPYEVCVEDLSQEADKRLRGALLAVYKAAEARRFGIIIGLKDGQFFLQRSLKLKGELERLGKEAELIAMREITDERLNRIRGVEAFIQTACPRLSVDGYTLDRPILSAPQADALLEVLRGREPKDFLMRAHWL